jgi:hypothetical protein
MQLKRNLDMEEKTHLAQLRKAYLSLVDGAKNDDDSRTASLGRFGALEVRLIEFAPRERSGTLDIWIELYDHEIQSTLDSCFCYDLDEAEPILEHLLASVRYSSEPRP